MWQKLQVILLVLISLTMVILVAQNSGTTDILVWAIQAPLSLYLLGAFALGFGFGWFGLMILNYRRNKTAAALAAEKAGV